VPVPDHRTTPSQSSDRTPGIPLRLLEDQYSRKSPDSVQC